MLKKVVILSTAVAFMATVPAFAASVASAPAHATISAKKSVATADVLKVKKKKKKKKEAAPSAI